MRDSFSDSIAVQICISSQVLLLETTVEEGERFDVDRILRLDDDRASGRT